MAKPLPQSLQKFLHPALFLLSAVLGASGAMAQAIPGAAPEGMTAPQLAQLQASCQQLAAQGFLTLTPAPVPGAGQGSTVGPAPWTFSQPPLPQPASQLPQPIVSPIPPIITPSPPSISPPPPIIVPSPPAAPPSPPGAARR